MKLVMAEPKSHTWYGAPESVWLHYKSRPEGKQLLKIQKSSDILVLVVFTLYTKYRTSIWNSLIIQNPYVVSLFNQKDDMTWILDYLGISNFLFTFHVTLCLWVHYIVYLNQNHKYFVRLLISPAPLLIRKNRLKSWSKLHIVLESKIMLLITLCIDHFTQIFSWFNQAMMLHYSGPTKHQPDWQSL
jgi:hypothetical protein